MELKKILIKNFKSIDKIQFEIKKLGDSFTCAFVGVNEAGKSNILEAMSLLKIPKKEFDFLEMCNQNNDTEEYVDIYFSLKFKDNKYIETLKRHITSDDNFINSLIVETVDKNVFLKRESKEFEEQYTINITPVAIDNYSYYTKKEVINESGKSIDITKYYVSETSKITSEDANPYVLLDEEKLGKLLDEILLPLIMKSEPKVSFWKPENKYLITTGINLKEFKENTDNNIPLRNVFYLAGFKNNSEIRTKIDEIERNDKHLRRLEKLLSDKSTKYLNSVWKEHKKVRFDFRISDQLICKVSIQDLGGKNEDNYFNMINRSDGFKQFLSLILTLSIENTHKLISDSLIIIDEPEMHLHPSGIRDMRNELIKIGQTNYVFIATHSNFMIDNKEMLRNVIIKKDSNNNTIKKEIKNQIDIKDDEVLRDAFGIDVYKDFLTPHKILVEGASDKMLLQKAIKIIDPSLDVGITNGGGNNAVAIASLLNFQDIHTLVILDDDNIGKKNKNAIIQIGNIFSDLNVFTIRDLVGVILADGTLEDTLDRQYVESKFINLYQEFFNSAFTETLEPNQPIINTIKIKLQQTITEKDRIPQFLEKLKIKISEEYQPTSVNMTQKSPHLKTLVEKIVEKLKE